MKKELGLAGKVWKEGHNRWIGSETLIQNIFWFKACFRISHFVYYHCHSTPLFSSLFSAVESLDRFLRFLPGFLPRSISQSAGNTIDQIGENRPGYATKLHIKE